MSILSDHSPTDDESHAALDEAVVVNLEPTHPKNRSDLARVDAYFERDDLAAEEIAWVQDCGLGVLRAEVLRLRAALARRAGGSL